MDCISIYLSEIKAAPRLSSDGGTEAIRCLVEDNLALVVYAARRYDRMWYDGNRLQDLIQEGNLGLVIAARKFNAKFGVRFGTYAMFWVRSYIQDFIHKDSAVRVPKRVRIWMKKKDRGEALTPKQEKFTRFMLCHQRELTREVSGVLVDFAEPIEALIAQEQPLVVNRLLERLDDSRATILRCRFGIGVEPLTLSEIGAKIGYTRERVRQIQNEALAYLGELMAG